MTFPDHGFARVITDVGGRQLLDIGVHTVWRPEDSGACGSVRRDAAMEAAIEQATGIRVRRH